MKYFLFACLLIAIVLPSCNNSKKPSNQTENVNKDTSMSAMADSTKTVEITHTYTDLDPKLSSSLKTIVDHYLRIKNALIADSGLEAANDGKAMAQEMSKIDKSLFTADQKKVYDNVEADLKRNAEHIGESASSIAHQREHFSMMSEDVYDLVKAFGGGQILYHDHCPMANDQKGAMWLSESKEVRNPYFAGKMNECVKIPEVIK
jgi:hypothetical protein